MFVHTESAKTDTHNESKEHVNGSRAIHSSETGRKAMRLVCSGYLLAQGMGSLF